jgi:RNA polymerase sigma-70 factor (ECF subfamily)
MRPEPLSKREPGVDDATLVAAVAAGDEAAVRLLTQRYNQTLFRTARSILRDDAEAEDALQDAYIKAIAAMGTFPRGRQARHVARAHRRQRGARPVAQDPPGGGGDHAGGRRGDRGERGHGRNRGAAGARSAAPESRAILERKIDELPDAFRAVFVLRAVEEMTVEEVAAPSSIPDATVRTRFFRARALAARIRSPRARHGHRRRLRLRRRALRPHHRARHGAAARVFPRGG